MDAFIQKHLEAWLERHVSDDERDDARGKILHVLDDLNHEVGMLGWNEILNRAA